MVKLNKGKIAEKLEERCDFSLQKTKIYDVISIIVDYLIEELENERIVSIENFGTFATWENQAKVNKDLNGKFRITKAAKLVRFIPSQTLVALLKSRRELLVEVGTTSAK